MTLSEAIKQYLVYLQAARTPARKMTVQRLAMQDILDFYGHNKPLHDFDDQTVLEYARVNDPFDCDKRVRQCGESFCNLVDWLMRNKMIPAWSKQQGCEECWVDFDRHEARDDLSLY